MVSILIIAHTPFATALRDCLCHIYGGLPTRIGALDIEADIDPAVLLTRATAEVQCLSGAEGVLVLTDIVGATPCNIAGRLALDSRVRVVSGVNLSMLVRAVCYRASDLDVLVEKAMAGGVQGIQAISAECVAKQIALCAETAPAAVTEAAPEPALTPRVPRLPEHHVATRNHNR